jgi:hypothetical protein
MATNESFALQLRSGSCHELATLSEGHSSWDRGDVASLAPFLFCEHARLRLRLALAPILQLALQLRA